MNSFISLNYIVVIIFLGLILIGSLIYKKKSSLKINDKKSQFKLLDEVHINYRHCFKLIKNGNQLYLFYLNKNKTFFVINYFLLEEDILLINLLNRESKYDKRSFLPIFRKPQNKLLQIKNYYYLNKTDFICSLNLFKLEIDIFISLTKVSVISKKRHFE